MMLFLFLKLQKKKKSSQNVKREQKFWIRKIFLRIVSFFVRLLTFVKQTRIFINFFGQWFLLAQQEWRSKCEKRAKVLDKEKFFEKYLFLCPFIDFCQTDKDISWLFWPVIPLGSTRMEEFLILFSWLYFLSLFRSLFC